MARQRRTLDEHLADLTLRERNTRTLSLTTPAMAALGPQMIADNAILNEHLSEGAVELENLDSDLKDAIGKISESELLLDEANERLQADAKRIDTLFEEVAYVPEQIAAAQDAAIAAAAATAKAEAEEAEARAAREALRIAEEKAGAAQAAALEAAKKYTDAQESGVSEADLEAIRQDAQAKADAAKAAAIAAAAADATAKKEAAEATAAADAKKKADAALAAAKTDAQTKADAALEAAKADSFEKMSNVANSKNATFYGTAAPTATNPKGTLAGDTYRRKDSSGRIIGEYEWEIVSGVGKWTQRKMTSSSMTAVDVGVLTAGTAVLNDAVAKKIAATTASFQTADIGNLFVTGQTHLNEAVAQTIAADTATFIKLSVQNLVAGSGTMDKGVINTLYSEVVESRLIRASMLEVGGNTNYASIAASADMWDYTTAGAAVDNTSYSDSAQGRALRFKGASGITSIYGKKFSVAAGDTLHVQGTFRNDGGAAAVGELTLGLQYLDAAGATLAWDIYATTSKEVLTHANRKTLKGVSTVPDGAAYARPLASTRAATGTVDATKYAYLIDPIIRHQVGSVLIGAGAITADKLEAAMVLSNRIIAGDPNGTRAEMSPGGFRVYAAQPEGGATEVVRMGVAETDDYFAVTKADGTLAATISQDGKVSGSEIYANEEMYFQGQRFSEILESLPRGALYKAELSGGRISNIDTTYGLVEASWVHTGDRLIRLDFGLKTFPNSTSETEVHLDVYYTRDGSTPTINSPRLFADAIALGRISQGSYDYKTFSHTIRPATFGNIAPGDTLRMLMCVRKGLGNPFHVEPGLQTYMYVTDIGPGIPHTPNHNNGGGKLSSGTSTVTVPKVTRTAEWTANAIRNYQGNGSVYPINNGKIYQGLSPAGYGNLCSAAIFPDMTATLSGASINWIKVYLYFEHWYYNAGGTARIGLTGKSLPGSMTAGGLATSSGGWPKPGGRWVDIPSNLWNGFKTGQWGGITLNGDGGYGTYGYASGNPKIQINYTK